MLYPTTPDRLDGGLQLRLRVVSDADVVVRFIGGAGGGAVVTLSELLTAERLPAPSLAFTVNE
ncbi:hypothetical protein D3C73_848140 [compost metagenome]